METRAKFRASSAVVGLILTVWAVVSLFPFFWNLCSAFKPVEEIFTYPPTFLPRSLNLINFQRLMAYFPMFWRNMFNSVFLALVIPTLQVLFNSMAGFAFAKLDFRGRDMLFKAVIATMLIPSASGYIPLFIEMSKLHLLDTYFAIILPGMASAFGVFLFRQAMRAVPSALLEAAKIDGASDAMLYARIAVPLIKPMMITSFIGICINTWNDYFWPLIALKTEAKLTFPVVLSGIQGAMHEAPWGTIMVGALILTMPTLIIYTLLSKYIVPDIFGGSVKG